MLRTLTALAVALCAAPASSQQQYAIDQLAGFDNFGDKSTGQTFTPSVGIVPDPGAPSTLALLSMTINKGNSGAAAPSATTFLNVYDGDPNAGGRFVGSSTNAIDTTLGQPFHTPLVWSFAQLRLDYTTEYWAVMSSTGVDGNLDVAVSLETHDRNLVPGLYAGGSGLIAAIARHPSSIDTTFQIVLEDASGLSGTPGQVSLSAGGSQVLSMTLDPAHAGKSYLVVGSATGTSPGIPFGGALVPLNPDPYLLYTLLNPNTPLLGNSAGFLDLTASATSVFTLPPLSDPSLAGLTVHHAGFAVDFSAGVFTLPEVTEAVPVLLVP